MKKQIGYIRKKREEELQILIPELKDKSSLEYLVYSIYKTKSQAEVFIRGFMKDEGITRERALHLLRSCGVYYSELPE